MVSCTRRNPDSMNEGSSPNSGRTQRNDIFGVAGAGPRAKHLDMVVGHGTYERHFFGLGGDRQQRTHAFDGIVIEQDEGLTGYLAGRGAALGSGIVGRPLGGVRTIEETQRELDAENAANGLEQRTRES